MKGIGAVVVFPVIVGRSGPEKRTHYESPSASLAKKEKRGVKPVFLLTKGGRGV